jgi:hypothetical protein
MRLDLIKKPGGVWASFNESCGTGDGTNKEFRTPIPASRARSVLVMRGFGMLAPDNRLVVMNEKDGTILRDEPDGYKLETRGEDELWIAFDRAPVFEMPVSVSGLGRQVGDAFKVLPMGTLLQQKIREKQPKIFRAPPKERDNVTDADIQEAGRVNFMELVVDWSGITGADEAPLPCTPENKKAFLDLKDAQFFGLFVSNRSAAIRAEGINSFSGDSSD